MFEIQEFFDTAPGKLYAAAQIRRRKLIRNGDIIAYQRILDLAGELFSYLQVDHSLPSDVGSFQTFDLAHYVGFTLEQEYEFLCLESEKERQQYMTAHLEKLLPVVKEMDALKEKIKMNGHFRNIVPPDFK